MELVEKARKTEAEQIRQIHVLKNKLGLDDLTYRSMLWDLYKAHSCKEMNYGQRDRLIARLIKEIKSSYASKSDVSQKQINLISYLGKKHCNNLTGFCAKIVKRDISSLQELTKQEGIKVIDALKRLEKGMLKGA